MKKIGQVIFKNLSTRLVYLDELYPEKNIKIFCHSCGLELINVNDKYLRHKTTPKKGCVSKNISNYDYEENKKKLEKELEKINFFQLYLSLREEIMGLPKDTEALKEDLKDSLEPGLNLYEDNIYNCFRSMILKVSSLEVMSEYFDKVPSNTENKSLIRKDFNKQVSRNFLSFFSQRKKRELCCFIVRDFFFVFLLSERSATFIKELSEEVATDIFIWVLTFDWFDWFLKQ